MKTQKDYRKQITALILAILTVFTAFVVTSCGKQQNNLSVVTREDGSGTKSAFMELLGLKGKADISGVVVATGTAGVLAEVRSNPNALAYESLGYVTTDVKMLKVDGVEATVANIKNGTYKISRPLQVVYQPAKGEEALNAAYLQFLASKQAQDIISEEGYVSMIDNASSYVPDPALEGTINISGSTSLQPLMLKLAEKYKELQSKVTVTVSGGGSGTGYKDAKEGVSDFGMISEEFNNERRRSGGAEPSGDCDGRHCGDRPQGQWGKQHLA